jgi:hypothetical protein
MAKKKNKKKKFKSRSQEVLKTVYDKREERSRSTGKSMWRSDCPLPEFIPERGKDYELFIFPLGYEPIDGLHKDLSVHFKVGPAFDAFVCTQIHRKEPCFRCEDQAVGTQAWRDAGGKKKSPYPDNLKAMFPWDRAGYILLDMTSEESMEKGLQLWAAPKENVHAEIAKKMHNKKKGTSVDITDFVDGRIVSVEVGERKTEEGTFPTYSISLEELEEEIGEEFQDQLAELCDEAIEAGFSLKEGGLIEYFLHWPEYEEVKQSHMAGMDRKKVAVEEEDEDEDEETGTEFDSNALEEIHEELDEMSKFKIKKHAKKTWGIVIEDLKDKEKDEVIDEIIETLKEGGGLPDCFSNYGDFEACSNCDHDDDCSDATEESTE